MKMAIHQPNFVPWFPFFYKMHHADKFVLMIHCQYEKNGFQNRAWVNDRWWTLPVKKGNELIIGKSYINGSKMVEVNQLWILAIAKTLGIDTSKVHFDSPTELKGTERLIEICKRHGCDEYFTNPDAVRKYVNEPLMEQYGLKIVPVDIPKQYHKSIFEMFNEHGISGTVKILNKDFTQCKA